MSEPSKIVLLLLHSKSLSTAPAMPFYHRHTLMRATQASYSSIDSSLISTSESTPLSTFSSLFTTGALRSSSVSSLP